MAAGINKRAQQQWTQSQAAWNSQQQSSVTEDTAEPGWEKTVERGSNGGTERSAAMGDTELMCD